MLLFLFLMIAANLLKYNFINQAVRVAREELVSVHGVAKMNLFCKSYSVTIT